MARAKPPPPILHNRAQTWAGSPNGGAFTKFPRPYTVPIGYYTSEAWIPITSGAGSVVLNASGAGTVQVGPQGLGTIWQVTQAAISTTTGANDVSTATIYAGQLGLATLVAAQSYAGGGSSAGLNDTELVPGLYVVCTWAGGVSGATATLVVYGRQRVLIPG